MNFSTKKMSRTPRSGILAMALASISLCLFAQVAVAQQAGGRGGSGGGGGRAGAIQVYTFKPKDISYHAPMKPVYHIKDMIAEHKGQTDWEQPVVKDAWFFIQYISMGPGKKTPVSMQGDTSIAFIVNSGKARFTFTNKDFPPIEAGEDGMVWIPARTPYSIETISDTPSIRFEVRNVVAGTLFPIADNPTPPVAPPGYETVKVNCGCMEASVKDMKPKYFDYGGWAKANPTAGSPPDGNNRFVLDDNLFIYTARSTTGVPLPPPNVIGHFHTGQAEWWYVLEGNMATRIEGQGDIYGDHGDFIYSPQGAYHQTIMLGKPSTRTPAGKPGVHDSAISLTPIAGGAE